MEQRAAVSNCRIKACDSIKDMCWSRRRRRTMKIVDECNESSLNYLSVKIRFFATRNQLQDSADETTYWANETRFYKLARHAERERGSAMTYSKSERGLCRWIHLVPKTGGMRR